MAIEEVCTECKNTNGEHKPGCSKTRRRGELVAEFYRAGLLYEVLKTRQETHSFGPRYQVLCDGDVKHPDCTAEDVIRALAWYLSGESHA